MTDFLRQLTPVSHARVVIDDSFWAPRLEKNRTTTLPTIFHHLHETGHLDAWKPSGVSGDVAPPHPFWDSDVAKWIEAVALSITTHPDEALERQVDELIDLIAEVQQEDGYLNTYYTTVEPEKRWTNLRDGHELYCAGHLIEAAVAYYRATGKRTLLDVMCGYVDYIGSVFGPEVGQQPGYPGHPEIELALVKLYEVTDEVRYLNLARFFIDERGQQPHYFDREMKQHGIEPGAYYIPGHGHNQSHRPVREQTQAVGHAVRAMYLYSGMVDVGVATGDPSLLDACRRLWEHATSKRMYLTGGLGTSHRSEGFTEDYDLPNETAYAETCAAIGFVFWNHRLLQLNGDGRYADAMERALYNGVISGVSLDGSAFHYVNPLQSRGDHHRQEWFSCACCPPNIARLIASLGQYIYSQSDHAVFVHLYVQGRAAMQIRDQTIMLAQQTRYPWQPTVRLHIKAEHPVAFTLALRIPGWCRDAALVINGARVHLASLIEKGYAKVTRLWNANDEIELTLPMPVERMKAHPQVRQNAGRVALQRGPIVYCLEETDNRAPLDELILAREADLTGQYDEALLGGVVSITGQAAQHDTTGWGERDLYRPAEPAAETITLKVVPYFAWDNRQPGEMLVWIPDGH